MPLHIEQIAIALDIAQEHRITSQPYGGSGHLSRFVCACGAQFTPSTVFDTPHEWVSMSQLHLALMSVRALNRGTVLDLPVLHPTRPYSVPGMVAIDRNDTFFRRINTSRGHRWLSQSSDVFTDEQVSDRSLSVIWFPTTR